MKSQDTWDKKESELFVKLTEEWEKYIKPGIIQKGITAVTAPIKKFIPQDVKDNFSKQFNEAMSKEIIKKVTDIAAKGFLELGKVGSRYTISKTSVVNALQKKLDKECSFDKICGLRSYEIEKCIHQGKFHKQLQALFEGGITGAPGLPGVPFNILLSLFLYFRAVEHIALFYGYDVIDDPRELQIASEVLINSISPTVDQSAAGAGGFIGKAMFCAEMSALGRACAGRKTYYAMAKSGGAELFYTQIRALANAAAKKGLEKAGKDGIENVFLKKIMQNIMRKLPKQAAGKSLPFIGAFIGAGFDVYYMSRVIDGANLQYHKRFLIEKDQRNDL